MNGNEAKKVELTDDRLEQVSGGALNKVGKYTVECPYCGCLGKGLTYDAARQMADEHDEWHMKERREPVLCICHEEFELDFNFG